VKKEKNSYLADYNIHQQIASRMVKTKNLVMPFVKWAGGKRQLITSIFDCLPANIYEFQYIEPFVGGGAVLFHLQPKNAVINDSNSELINVYQVIKKHPLELISDLKKHVNEAGYYYELRAFDRSDALNKLTPLQRASRIIYLNKTCYNGLYRVNNAGEFNVPFGRYKNPNIVNEPTIMAVSRYLNANNIIIKNDDYAEVLKQVGENAFVYLDPPYHPISESSYFTGYVQGGWNMSDQIRLREACDALHSKGVKFLQSNSSAPFIKEQYRNYKIITVKANRAVNSNGAGRGEIEEVLIRNYE
jgi:DNA adenine methylase